MERVITLRNQNSLYLSLRFELSDSFKELYCLDCMLYQRACLILEKSIPNRIVSRINLSEITDENVYVKCGDIGEILK